MANMTDIINPFSFMPEEKPTVIIVGEKGLTVGKKDYVKMLASALSDSFNVLPPVNEGHLVWGQLLEVIPVIIIISHTISDIDAINLISLLKSSYYCSSAKYFLCVRRINKAIESVCEDNKIDGIISIYTPIEKTVEDIKEKYREYLEEPHEYEFSNTSIWRDDPTFFSDVEYGRITYSGIMDDLLVPLGIERSLKGAEYIRYILAMRAIGVTASLNVVYGYVAVQNNTSIAAVEKSIRYAIERAWTKGDISFQHILFGNSTDASRGKPTNSEFIATIYEHMQQKARSRFTMYDV